MVENRLAPVRDTARVTPPMACTTSPGFEPVAEAFRANFSVNDEVGAALEVVVDGHVAVRACGGWADVAETRPWSPTTLVNGFSTGKAWVGVAALREVAAGRLSLDAPLAQVWPEFAAAGKEGVTLRHALTHQAGLPGVREPLAPGAQFDWPVMCAALAASPTWWPPGEGHGYHVNSYGFIVGEAVRRSSGRRIRDCVADLASMADADIHVGAPAGQDDRVAEFRWEGAVPASEPPEDEAARLQWAVYLNPPGLSGNGVVNSAAWRAAEVPSANGHTSAQGLARFYEALLRADLLPPSLLTEATTPHSDGDDLVLGRPSRFGLGFQLTQPERPFGVSRWAYGHFGAGGSLGFADPEAGIAFGYVTASMGPRWQNPRNRALLEALVACL